MIGNDAADVQRPILPKTDIFVFAITHETIELVALTRSPRWSWLKDVVGFEQTITMTYPHATMAYGYPTGL